jgi:HD superfamily phosphohydrolase
MAERDYYRYKRIRDPVHGDIGLSAAEVKIINTPEFQRLRGIKQLGLVELVYPGATHHRFIHCLGTVHIVQQAFDALLADPKSKQNIEHLSRDRYGSDGIDTIRKIIRFAALLHDLGHVPFSHTLEDEANILSGNDEHENRTLQMIENSDVIRETLGSLGEEVKRVITGTHQLSFMNDLVGNTISADLLDYLSRDLFFTGLQGRGFDKRILEYFGVDEKGRFYINLFRGGRERIDVRSELVHILRTRYELAEKVYYHHAKVAADAMFAKAFWRAKELGEITEDRLRGLTDSELLSLLEQSKDPVVRKLIEMLRARRLYKVTYMQRAPSADITLLKPYHGYPQKREELENQLAQEAGLDAGDVVIFCPDPDMQLKEAAVHVLWYKRNVEAGGIEQRIEPFKDIKPDLGNPIELHKAELDLIIKMHQALWSFIIFVHPAKYRMFTYALSIEDFCKEKWPHIGNLLRFLDPVREEGEWVKYDRLRKLCEDVGDKERLTNREKKLVEKRLVEEIARRNMPLEELYDLPENELKLRIEGIAKSVKESAQGIPLIKEKEIRRQDTI